MVDTLLAVPFVTMVELPSLVSLITNVPFVIILELPLFTTGLFTTGFFVNVPQTSYDVVACIVVLRQIKSHICSRPILTTMLRRNAIVVEHQVWTGHVVGSEEEGADGDGNDVKDEDAAEGAEGDEEGGE